MLLLNLEILIHLNKLVFILLMDYKFRIQLMKGQIELAVPEALVGNHWDNKR